MTVSAHDIAAVLRDRLPGLPVKKLHKLLYYCQGHHLANFDEPLFSEPISAWDMGPVVGNLWYQEKEQVGPPPARPLGEAELNTVGYVLSRYGALTGRDLENLTHSEAPWKLADTNRGPQESAPIKLEWIRGYFQTAGAPGDDEDPIDAGQVRQLLARAASRGPGPDRADDIGRLKARFARSA